MPLRIKIDAGESCAEAYVSGLLRGCFVELLQAHLDPTEMPIVAGVLMKPQEQGDPLRSSFVLRDVEISISGEVELVDDE